MVFFRIALAVTLLSQLAWPQAPLNEARLRSDLAYLTSKPLAGRAPGHKGADAAAAYIAREFEKAGLEPCADKTFLQEFVLVTQAIPGKARLRLFWGGQSKDAGFSMGMLMGAARTMEATADVAFVGYGITAPEYGYDDYAAIDVKGKIVIVMEREPLADSDQAAFRGTADTIHAMAWSKVMNAQRHGAAGVLFAPLAGRGPLVKGARPAGPMRILVRDDGVIQIPILGLTTQLFTSLMAGHGYTPETLRDSIDKTGKPASFVLRGLRIQMRTGASGARVKTANVIGMIRGSDPTLGDETVLIGAHYDHLGVQRGKLYAGANDNASGTVAVLELARALAAGPRPKRTIVFAAFGAEETGLHGSYYYTTHPLRPLAGTVMLNLDMIGRHEEAAVGMSEAFARAIPEHPEKEINLVGCGFSQELCRIIAQHSSTVELKVSDRYERDAAQQMIARSDHTPFLLNNVPAVLLFTGGHRGNHDPSDTAEKIDYTQLRNVARLAELSALQLANAAALPRFVP